MSSILSSFDIARQSLDTAMNDSEGSAERELSNYQKGKTVTFMYRNVHSEHI